MSDAARRAAVVVVFVVAIAENGVIGHDNALPWRIKSDMQRFRALTMHRPVVMGRKTFDSIGKPLKGRTNIVVSRDPLYCADDVVVAPNLDHALVLARGDALRRGAAEIAVIGGADIFRQALPVADRLEVTLVHATPEGDTFFKVDSTVWRESGRSRQPRGPSDSADTTFVTYAKISADAKI